MAGADAGGKRRTRRRGLFVLRCVAALSVLAAFLALYGGMLTDSARISDLMHTQLSAAAVGAGAASATVALFLVLALLAGRVFCSVFCPLGTAQEIFWRAGRAASRRGNRTGCVRPPGIRYAIPLLAAAGIALGFAPLAVAADPISTFGRGCIALRTLLREGIAGQPPILFLSIAVPAAILGFALSRGRRFCDWCPAGVSLGLASRFAPFGIVLDKHACTSCGRCEAACPANCVDAGEKSLDRERCVLCLSCLAACPAGSLSYGAVRGTAAGRREFGADVARKAAGFALGLAYFGGAGVRNATEGNGAPGGPGGGTRILPPGAVGERHFAARCVACQACVAACPVRIVKMKRGAQPELDYSRDYCQYTCTRCGEACPAGAIQPLSADEKRRTRVAFSRLTLDRCVVLDKGRACGACAEVCPTRALVMRPYGEADAGLTAPDFDEQYCIGCGACLVACPAEPSAFAMEPVRVQTLTPGIRPSSDAEGLPPLPTLPGEHDFPF